EPLQRDPDADQVGGDREVQSAVTASGAPPVRADRPRRTRSVSEGSVGQTAAETPVTEPAAAEPSAEPSALAPSAAEPQAGPAAAARPRSSDAPWHNPVPAHDEKPSAGKPAGKPPARSAEEPSGAPGEPAEQKDDTSAGPADQDGDGA
ncbi:NADH-quinone oxidoreductase subunit C, partial [Kitasatospora sp. NPDC036755]